MVGENTHRRFPGTGSELQHVAHLGTERRRCDGGLELLVARDLVEHLLEIGLRIPLEAAHGADHTHGYSRPMTLASVSPLVTARAVAQAYTYEVPEGTEKGAVVEVRFGNARRRGVVTEVGVLAPDGVKTALVE